LKCLRAFPPDARQDAGFQLDAVQRGEEPMDWKPMPSIGRGVAEIRVWDEAGAFRMIHTADLPMPSMSCTLSRKKTQATAKHDIDLAKKRFDQLMKEKS
jgi:phage-related protein